MRKCTCFLFFATLFSSCQPTNLTVEADSLVGDNIKHIKAAVQDYVEGLYDGDTIKLKRSIYPDLVKRGYWRWPENNPEYSKEAALSNSHFRGH